MGIKILSHDVMHQRILDLFGLFKNRNSIRFWPIKPKLRLNNNQNEVNGTMIECILKLPLIQLTAWWFLNTAVIFWLSIFIRIKYKSTCWGGASGSFVECNISEFTALVKIEGNYFWKLYKSVSKQGAVNRKNSPWPCSRLQRPQFLAAHSSIFPSCHGSSDVNRRWRQACHLLEQRNTRCMTLFPWLPPPGWMGMSIAGLGLAGTESWNPHIWLISVAYGHLIFGWWLPVVPQRLDCSEDSGLFFSTQYWRRWPQLGLLFADVVSAPQGLETGRRWAQPTQWGHQAPIDPSSIYCQERL